MYYFIQQYTYLRIEVFDGVAKKLMKNVNSARTWALITSQGVSRFKNLKRTKPNKVNMYQNNNVMTWQLQTEWNIHVISPYHWPTLVTKFGHNYM